MTKPGAIAPPSSLKTLKQRALTLGSANSFDYASQFLLPLLLVRCLSAEEFGQYRLLWLTVMTVMAVVSLAMPQSLYYFLPRSDAPTRRLYVHQTLLYMLGVGLLGGWAVSAWNPLQPQAIDALNRFGLLLPCLVLFWVSSSLLDVLPTIEERVRWQAGVTIALATLRALTLGAAAWLSGELRVLIWLLLALLLVKFLLLLRYIGQHHGLAGRWLAGRGFLGQLRHAAPFGLSSALFTLRGQADQWVVASLFAVHSFAAFSIAAVLGPLVNLFRVSVNHAFLPSMSRLHASGDLSGMLNLNSQANVMVGRLVYPLLAFAFVFAEEMVTVVYTAQYVEAAAVMRVYIFALLAMVVELFSITLLLKEGAYALRLNLLALSLSVALSWFGAVNFGLPGAAAGSVAALYLDRLLTLRRIGQRLALPLRQLQDWRTLLLLIAYSALAGLLAWSVTTRYLADSAPILRLLAGGSLIATVYGALYGLFGKVGRSGPFPTCSQKA
jgi:O-antigen/teichoic acid export membrane protein